MALKDLLVEWQTLDAKYVFGLKKKEKTSQFHGRKIRQQQLTVRTVLRKFLCHVLLGTGRKLSLKVLLLDSPVFPQTFIIYHWGCFRLLR